MPTPLLFEFLKHEVDAPSCFLVDLLEYLQDFFLLAPICQAFSSVCQGADGHTRDTPMIMSAPKNAQASAELLTCLSREQ